MRELSEKPACEGSALDFLQAVRSCLEEPPVGFLMRQPWRGCVERLQNLGVVEAMELGIAGRRSGGLCSDHRTISSGQGARCRTAYDTLPNRKRVTPWRPCEPIRIKSGPEASASRRIASARREHGITH